MAEIPSRSTGRVPGPWRAPLLVAEGLWEWYRRNWRATVVSSVLNPLFFLLALGFGLGSQIDPGSVPGGMRYAVYLAPALLATAAVQNAAGESTFPILSSFRWSKVYWGMSSTPVTPGQIAGGQLLWIALRLVFSGLVFVLVAALLGAVAGPGVLLGLLFSVLTGMAFAAPVVAYAATLETEGQQFSPLFRFVLMPMTLFAGTFFPVSELPVYIRPLAWATPLWHGTELSRGATFGHLELWPAVGHVAYLAVLFAVGAVLARRQFQRRLGV
jgi:lipooligosaccharide transport system permease protein